MAIFPRKTAIFREPESRRRVLLMVPEISPVLELIDSPVGSPEAE